MPAQALQRLKDCLWAIAFAGLAAAGLRFSQGLGATTGLNDAAPWGLWIAFKLGFVALSGGGFTLVALVYIFHLETYRPLLRRAILLAMLGYGSFIVSLIFDLGLPWHIYMPLIRWQHHSVMFEIAWCVMLYFSVLVLEFAPVILEHSWFQRPVFARMIHGLHLAILPLVIAGIVLSTLHQSSLGSLFLIMPHRVHPLWYSPAIPVLFFISALSAGILALIVEGHLAQVLFNRRPDPTLMNHLGKIGAFTLWLYLGVRLVDLVVRQIVPEGLNASWQGLWFTAEIVLGGILPAALLSTSKIRASASGLVTSAGLAIAGILSQRMALSMFTMTRPAGMPYTPSVLEIIIAFAIPAAAGLIYLLFSENLAVHTGCPSPAHTTGANPPLWESGAFKPTKPAFRYTFAARSGIAVPVIALTMAAFAAVPAKSPQPVHPARGWKVLTIDGDYDRQAVIFPHVEHQDRLAADSILDPPGETAACITCHHLAVASGDEAIACSECHRDFDSATSIFDHTHHNDVLSANLDSRASGNAVCGECHRGEHRKTTAVQCVECHTGMTPLADQMVFHPQASGYKDAMHNRCLNCHQQQAALQNLPSLAVCSTCHTRQSADLQAGRRLTGIEINGNRRNLEER